MKVSISNFYEHSDYLPDTIDRTVRGILKKKTRKIIGVGSDLESTLNRIIYKEVNISKNSFWHFLLDHSKWVRYNYSYRKDKAFYKANEQRCDRCGRFSPKSCYCKHCEKEDERERFSEFVKNKKYHEAIEVLLNETKQ